MKLSIGGDPIKLGGRQRALALLGAGGGYGPEQTLTLQPDGTAGVDTFLSSLSSASNFGSHNTIAAGEGNDAAYIYRTLIRFDLSGLPANALITSAILSLYATGNRSDNDRTFRIYRLKRAWAETQATWNIYSTGNNWQTAGGFGADDCEQNAIGSRAFVNDEAINEFKDFILTPTSKADLDLGNGWLIKADSETDDMFLFASSDNATAANRPKLVVKYRVPL